MLSHYFRTLHKVDRVRISLATFMIAIPTIVTVFVITHHVTVIVCDIVETIFAPGANVVICRTSTGYKQNQVFFYFSHDNRLLMNLFLNYTPSHQPKCIYHLNHNYFLYSNHPNRTLRTMQKIYKKTRNSKAI